MHCQLERVPCVETGRLRTGIRQRFRFARRIVKVRPFGPKEFKIGFHDGDLPLI